MFPWLCTAESVLPLPRDPSPTEREGSAADYSGPWRWAGHVLDTWTLAACRHSPHSYTKPRGACSQDHSWGCTAERNGKRENIRQEGRERKPGEGAAGGRQLVKLQFSQQRAAAVQDRKLRNYRVPVKQLGIIPAMATLHKTSEKS